ncbi:hypothetical protein IC614_11120 [Allosphingosinicella flava]|uniref:Lipoprotein n=1 Tax=Allosphingosinicella flava TaxID=2771430 RepID=A0A7T2GJ67_9SPHN|nr:hypothetical protein [Sphingosinicella flava]QPQ54854.1 hypothetical protein IC614_11120 [Sphingosinicella flava]
MRFSIFCGLIPALALAACSSADEDDAGNAARAADDGVAEVTAPGFNMSIALPAGAGRDIEITTDQDALFPGAKAEGLSLATDPATGTQRVNLGFASERSVDEVAKWYANPRSSRAFKVNGINITNGVQTMSVRDESGEYFNVILKPGADGGTEGTLQFRD